MKGALRGSLAESCLLADRRPDVPLLRSVAILRASTVTPRAGQVAFHETGRLPSLKEARS